MSCSSSRKKALTFYSQFSVANAIWLFNAFTYNCKSTNARRYPGSSRNCTICVCYTAGALTASVSLFQPPKAYPQGAVPTYTPVPPPSLMISKSSICSTQRRWIDGIEKPSCKKRMNSTYSSTF